MKKLLILAIGFGQVVSAQQLSNCSYLDPDHHVQECSVKRACPPGAHVHPIAHHYPNPDPKQGPIPGDMMCHSNANDKVIVGSPIIPKPAVPAKK